MEAINERKDTWNIERTAAELGSIIGRLDDERLAGVEL